jgi:hypothetical protein
MRNSIAAPGWFGLACLGLAASALLGVGLLQMNSPIEGARSANGESSGQTIREQYQSLMHPTFRRRRASVNANWADEVLSEMAKHTHDD